MLTLFTALEMLGFSFDTQQPLVEYLFLGNYLCEQQLDKAVNYLSAVKPFQHNSHPIDSAIIKQLLQQCLLSAKTTHGFNPRIFLDNLAAQDYFALDDIIDLFTFLQQTAYARHFGAERDTLCNQPWMIQNANELLVLANQLGVKESIGVNKLHYCGVGIMGSVSHSCGITLEFFCKHVLQAKLQQQFSYDKAWVLTGQRELSLGLDTLEDIYKVAQYFAKDLKFVKRRVGDFVREFAEGITEAMFIDFLMTTLCPAAKIKILESLCEPGHWRGTGWQSAQDIAKIVVKKIQRQELMPDLQHDCFYFLVVAAQPAILRLAMQVERAFTMEIRKHNLSINLKVIAAGPGLQEDMLANIKESNVLARVNSELAALAAERYYHARIKLHDLGYRNLRDSKAIMFATREN